MRRRKPVNNKSKLIVTIEDLADRVEDLNEEKNYIIKQYNKIRKELYSLMLAENITEITTSNGVSAFLEASERAQIDIYKLRELIDEEAFLKIVSATQKSVIEYVGSAILNQCSVMKRGELNVKTKRV